ncbi:MAG: DSD1 family PLP-dependent enzyme [Alphaproteobacteria bacterium]|nr:DSD1 family PLP-dependent enzyme [Alphaproteobacteria bacterium]MBL7099147.1 DSD1 family PLP-dependent enzyme [Alphaproteobacteria bacterium]
MASLNEPLIGVPGGRAKLQTPALVIDLDAFERNLAAMVAHAKRVGIGLRPHAKTHKSAEIARRQIAAGANGICCAKLGEAEALAAQGIDSILLTSPVVTDAGIARLMTLNARIGELIVVTDNAIVAARLDAAAQAAGTVLKVLVDIDPGMSRTGIRAALAPALVAQVAEAGGLAYLGLQCYAGQVQHMESPNERRDASLKALKELGELRDTLAKAGHAPKILSGGGTGTFDIDPDARVLTELQVGSYIFMDKQYNDVWEKPGDRLPFETSLYVQSTVISANRPGLATTDAGLKSFATDAGPPFLKSGAPEGAVYFFFGDEQGGITYPRDGAQLQPGDVVSCVVPHCDPTVNLYDRYHCVRGDTLEAIWSVDGRGRSA